MTRVGILGGGQLALMLCQAAQKMGLNPLVLTDHRQSAVARVTPHLAIGAIDDKKALKHFLAQVDLVIFENEFVNCEKLAYACRANNKPISDLFRPGLSVIAKLQDKLFQKKLLFELKIPTAPYEEISANRFKEQLHAILKKWEGQCVLKWAKMGYDGKGVLIIDDSPLSLEKAEAFCQNAFDEKIQVFAENKVAFRRELAMMSVVSTRDELLHYPLVVSEQFANICYRVIGPATCVGVAKKQEVLAREYARELATSLGIVGAFGIEFFENENGEILVNEIAPRVHNSGHYTQDACVTDQFENHWRGVLGLPLGSISSAPAFAMLNLLGPDFSDVNTPAIAPKPEARLNVHWYGKTELKYKRKLGHINGVVESIADLDSLLEELNRAHKAWIKDLSNGARSV